MQLPILNLREARFECTFGRGCNGHCCRHGRPPVYPEEARLIESRIEKFLPLLRPQARIALERHGFLTRRRKAGQCTMRVAAGWCIFFNKGCVLHRVGAFEGDKFRYKPAACALFPLAKDEHDRWYVRQKGYQGEIWDLVCLDPKASAKPAAETLKEEIAQAERFTASGG